MILHLLMFWMKKIYMGLPEKNIFFILLHQTSKLWILIYKISCLGSNAQRWLSTLGPVIATNLHELGVLDTGNIEVGVIVHHEGGSQSVWVLRTHVAETVTDQNIVRIVRVNVESRPGSITNRVFTILNLAARDIVWIRLTLLIHGGEVVFPHHGLRVVTLKTQEAEWFSAVVSWPPVTSGTLELEQFSDMNIILGLVDVGVVVLSRRNWIISTFDRGSHSYLTIINL